MKEERILEQLDKMVASGRVTKDEAAAIRTAAGTDEFERAVGAIQARHAGENMDRAVAAGDMTPEEAAAYTERLQKGDHPTGLRARLSKHRPRKHDAT
jgi:polyhydroxyalkanoate synthesis regulator phasin